MSPFPEQPPRRGEVYWIDFHPARGSEQAGRRPAVVVSNDVMNRYSPTIVVAAITGAPQTKQYPQNVTIPGGLQVEGTILGGQLTTIDKTRLEGFRCRLDAPTMAALDAALAVSLGIPRPAEA